MQKKSKNKIYRMSISRNYAPQTIGRPNTLTSGGDLRSSRGTTASVFRTVEQKALPALRSAGLFAARQAAKAGTGTFKTIGQGVGLAAGVGASVAAANPELLPYLGSAGGYLGGKAGEYLQKKANTAIDKWR